MIHLQEWRPIKTAPRNQWVLIGAVGFPYVSVSRLVKSRRRLTTGKYLGWLNTAAKWTHWMPLPTPPEDEGAKR